MTEWYAQHPLVLAVPVAVKSGCFTRLSGCFIRHAAAVCCLLWYVAAAVMGFRQWFWPKLLSLN